MSKLTEEKEEATKYIALQQWVRNYIKEHSKNPPIEQIVAFQSALNERQPPKSPEALVNLIEDERLMRRFSMRIARDEMIDPNHFHLDLMPSTAYTVKVKAGHPSIIVMGITTKDSHFKIVLRAAIRRAEKMWMPSSLMIPKKEVEYKRDIRKWAVYKDSEDYYPLLSPERIQVIMYETVRLVDMITGEMITRTSEKEKGMYKHYKNVRYIQQARLDLSRKMYSEGKLKEEDFEFDNPTND